MCAQVVCPLLELCDRDELSCVPHYTVRARASFREFVAQFERHMRDTKARLHLLCFLVKEQVGHGWRWSHSAAVSTVKSSSPGPLLRHSASSSCYLVCAVRRLPVCLRA